MYHYRYIVVTSLKHAVTSDDLYHIEHVEVHNLWSTDCILLNENNLYIAGFCYFRPVRLYINARSWQGSMCE